MLRSGTPSRVRLRSLKTPGVRRLVAAAQRQAFAARERCGKVLLASKRAKRFPQLPAADGPTFYFFCRLMPPRPTFANSMTPAEHAIMQAHEEYWHRHAVVRRLLILGPVNDAAGVWRLLILRVGSAFEAEQLIVMDPAISSDIGMTYEISAMIRTVEGRAC